MFDGSVNLRKIGISESTRQIPLTMSVSLRQSDVWSEESRVKKYDECLVDCRREKGHNIIVLTLA